MRSSAPFHPVIRHGPVLLLTLLAACTVAATWIVNPHSVSWLLAIYLTLVLFLAGMRNAKRSQLHGVYALYMAMLNQYLLVVWYLHVSVPWPSELARKDDVLLGAHLTGLGSIYVAIALYRFTLVFSEVRSIWFRIIEWLGWGSATVFAVTNFTGHFTVEYVWAGFTWVPAMKGLYLDFFYHAALFHTLSIAVPVVQFFRLRSVQRRLQLFYFILGGFPFWAACFGHFLLSIGINIYPAGGFLFLFHAGLIGYATLKHRVFDITIVIRRGLAYAGVSVAMGMIFGLVTYGGGLLLGGMKETAAQLPIIAFILISGFVLVPLYSWIQGLVDGLFFRRANDRQKSLGQFASRVSSTLDLFQVCAAMHELMHESLRPSDATLYLATDSGKMVLYGTGKDRFFPSTWPEGPEAPKEVSDLLRDQKRPATLALPVEAPAGKVVSMGGGSQSVAVPIRHQEKVLGVAVLGPRIADEEYGDDEIEWLELVAAQASVALSNAKTFASVKYLTGLTEKIVEGLSAGLVLMDANGRLLRWNSAAQRILAISPGEFAPATIESLWERQPILASAIKRSIQMGEDVSNQELRLEGKKPLWVLLGVGVLRGARGEKEYLITLHDISDYKAMEFLAQTNAALAQLGQLIASINHEVKNMIQPMRYQVESLLRSESKDAKAANSLEIVLNRIDALEELLNSLKDLSRPIQLTKRKITLWKLVDSVLLDIAELPQAKAIQFEASIPKHASCLGDGHWLKRVIYNLIRNASEATAKIAEPRIDISGNVQGGRIELSISDNGCGIKEEHLTRLFEPFFSTKAEAGTGLGLSISHRIIELHGGHIRVKSEVGKGTTFTLELPLAQEITSQETSSSS